MVEIDLVGHTALVTGSSGGIGAAIALRLAEAGAAVVVHYRRDAAGAERICAQISRSGGCAHLARADLTEPAQVASLFDGSAPYGPIDVLVNNAGIYPSAPALEMTSSDWASVVRANTDTVFTCSREAALAMREHGSGSIINIASLSALRPAMNQSHYNSSKAAVISFGGIMFPCQQPAVCVSVHLDFDLPVVETRPTRT